MSWNSTKRTISHVLSQPVQLHWLGWTADTISLQQAGWDISVHEVPHEQAFDMALKYAHSSGRVVGMSERVRHDYFGRLRRGSQSWGNIDHMGVPRLDVNVRMTLAHEIILNVHRPRNLWEFSPVDAMPKWQEYERIPIEDLVLFRHLPHRAQEIIIQPPSFEDLMGQVLEMQAPKQKEIREKIRRGDYDQQADVGAIIRVA